MNYRDFFYAFRVNLLKFPFVQFKNSYIYTVVFGELPERSNGTVSKTVVLVTVPGVRIPHSPLNG